MLVCSWLGMAKISMMLNDDDDSLKNEEEHSQREPYFLCLFSAEMASQQGKRDP